METKVLHWARGHTHGPHSTDTIRLKFSVAPIADKMREAYLRWYDHVLRRKEDSAKTCKTGLKLEVSGKRPREQHWADTLHVDKKVAGGHPHLALDRERWRHDTSKADPTMKRGKILSSAENANNGTPRKRSKSASEDATSDDQKKSGKKKKKSGSDDFVSEDRKKRSSTEEGNNDVQKKTSSEDDPNQRRSFECAAFENAMKKSFEA
ncbi:unnamed protein product [Heligmosomoides polygyrus]|uniref:Kin17_mid domain-containing protein n=1 Tax=Heligmosomoides polygyrus TaxID=6339 RepID=A0A183FFA9_HELPZ|nr:unnamed protein product [Heligmosomoides polygyrus]